MAACNASNSSITYALYSVLESTGVGGSVFMIVILTRVAIIDKTIKFLLINDHVACLATQVAYLALVGLKDRLTVIGLSLLASLLRTVNISTVVSQLLINRNLYLAVCRATAYRNKVTNLEICCYFLACWVYSFSLGYLSHVHSDYWRLDCKVPGRITISTKPEYTWLFAVHLVMNFILPTTLNGFILWKVLKTLKLQTINPKENITKLVKIMLVNTIVTTLMLSPSMLLFHIASFFNVYWLRVYLQISFFAYMIYRNVRPIVYIYVYRPLWIATKALCKLRKRGTVDPLHPSHSNQEDIVNISTGVSVIAAASEQE